jgi:TetR/AcrR family transcriptional regulator, repressor for neighboring sulfatase
MRGVPRGDSRETKALILASARDLFADRGVENVSVRDVARRAGVQHSLVHRYFGTKEDIVREITRAEVESIADITPPLEASAEVSLAGLRQILLSLLSERRTTVKLILQAELSGLEPEMILRERRRPEQLLAEWMRAHRPPEPTTALTLADPAAVSAIVGAAIMSLAGAGPWILSGAGLDPDEFDQRKEEFVDVLVALVAEASGAT